MYYIYLVVLLVPDHRVHADVDIGSGQHLGEIRFKLLPGLFRNKCTVLCMDDPVYPVHVRDGTVILFFSADKGEQKYND